ncbi:MAG: amidohydrolase family protein, partial [Bacteroidota bacterium]
VDGWLEAFRALRATEEMEIPRVALAGMPDVAPVIDRIRARGVPVIAPLALPDTVASDSLSEAIAIPLPSPAAPGGVSFVTDRRTVSFRDTEAEKGALTAQRIASVQSAEVSPARLAAAEVPFAFGSFEAKGKDIRANLHRMVGAGLSPEAALAALTTQPAEMFGLGNALGTVERGKLANLIVTTGDYFVDSTEVRFVFVEGVRHELEAKKPAASGDPDAEANALGTWSFEVSTPGGDQTGTFTFTGSNDALEGTISTGGDSIPLSSVSLEGNALSFSFTSPDGPDVTVSGIITDDEFEGTADVGAFGAFPLTATRQPE